jgi:hypothetical protein
MKQFNILQEGMLAFSINLDAIATVKVVRLAGNRNGYAEITMISGNRVALFEEQVVTMGSLDYRQDSYPNSMRSFLAAYAFIHKAAPKEETAKVQPPTVPIPEPARPVRVPVSSGIGPLSLSSTEADKGYDSAKGTVTPRVYKDPTPVASTLAEALKGIVIEQPPAPIRTPAIIADNYFPGEKGPGNEAKLLYQGVTRTVKEWAKLKGLKPSTLQYRLQSSKWSIKRALETPV